MKNLKTLLLLLVFSFSLTATAFTHEKKSDEVSVIKVIDTSVDADLIINQFQKTPMANISIKVNLTQLKHVKRTFKGASGDVECLVIPIKENDLYVGEKNISINLSAFQLKEKRTDSKATHIIKQQLSKELYNLLSDEEKRDIPILGDAVYWGAVESNPVESSTISDSSGFSDEEPDDLPF